MGLNRDDWLIALVSTTWDVGKAMDKIFDSGGNTGEVGNVRTLALVEKFSDSHHEVCQICMVDCLANGISNTLTCGHILCKSCVEDVCRSPYAKCTFCRTVIAPTLNVPRSTVQIVEHAYAVWVIPGAPEMRGIWLGGSRAWSRLLKHLPHHRYCYSDGTRLVRVDNSEDALNTYAQEQLLHQAPENPNRFHC